ncbi:putative serine/threonine-protein kinase clkA [Metarhizium anisopliae]|nr:putative serine/threonine-protein kinase clkA [Metarhizium anisopliae]
MRGHSHRFVRLSKVPNTTYNINSQVDLKPDNILVKIEDPAILDRDARDEYVNPLPQKVTDKGIIYLSRNDYGQFSKPTGIIQITDFGSSVSGKIPHSGCIQADSYRAPEVILDAGYSYSADIWSLGVMIWDLLEGRRLLDSIDERIGEEYDERVHIAQLTGLLGPPSDDILSSGQRTSIFYTPDVPQDIEFEKTVTRISGPEKAKFLEFAKRMIRWNPSERSTARDLLKDPWLYEDYPSEMSSWACRRREVMLHSHTSQLY